jgi:signal transduction histidine kinase
VGEAIWPSFMGSDDVVGDIPMGPLPQSVRATVRGTFGALSVISLWTNDSPGGSPTYSNDEIAPQSIAYLAVFPSEPGGTPSAVTRMRRAWGTWVSGYYLWFLGALGALLAVSLVLSPAAFVIDRRQRARDRIREEMERLQRDAHDKVYNRLSALSKRVATASDSARSELSGSLAAIAEDIRGTVGELQDILGQDVSGANGQLAQLPLSDQIADVCRAQSVRLGIKVEFEFSADVPLVSPVAGWDLQCVAEEALTNAARHGHATHALVTVAAPAGSVVLTVADDGAGKAGGIAIDELPEGSTGLRGARERMRRLGGTLEIESSSAGTVLSASVPLGA